MNPEEIRKRIWFIADGVPLELGNMTIRTTDSDKLLVIGCTSTLNIKNISKRKIVQELDGLKTSFLNLLKSVGELNDLIKNNNLTVEYHIAYDDAGEAGIGLCSEIGGTINWYV